MYRYLTTLGVVVCLFVCSFSANANNFFIKKSGEANLFIKKSDLGKDFLLRASIIPQAGVPTSHGTSSRVVQLQKKGNEIFLMESTKGHVVTHDLPSQFILASIPIKRTSQEGYTLDFNEGMKKVFIAQNWYASDSSGKNYNPYIKDIAHERSHSFIEKMKSTKEGLSIWQVVQLKIAGIYHPTLEVRYYLSPYKENSSFQPKETSKFKRVGFFETPPVLETQTGRSSVKITKWDISKGPITYYISANTPKEYQDAIREGILYWNKAFGKDVLKAELAPKNVTAPDMHHNIIQWVPWETAGFAYADALSDPRTGEILNSQVFMTSVFAFSSIKRARQLLRALNEIKNSKSKQAEQTPEQGIGILKSERLCEFDLLSEMTKELETLVSTDADDARVLQVSQDMVRSVIAHEVGHTLGLRHNFMGHAHANISLEERDEILKRYLQSGEEPPLDKIVTSSVMDYLPFADDIISGNQIRRMDQAFDYDKLAIEWAYENKSEFDIDREKAPLFCTDSDADGSFGDCKRFYSGKHPIGFHVWSIENTLKGLPSTILEYFIRAKAPADERDKVPLDEVVLPIHYLADELTWHLENIFSWLNQETRSATLERRESFVGAENKESLNLKKLNWVAEEVNRLGGVKHVFFSLFPNYHSEKTDKLTAFEFAHRELKSFFKAKAEQDFVGLDGKTYRFSQDELKLIEGRAMGFLAALESEVLDLALTVLSKIKVDLEYSVLGGHKNNGLSAHIETQLRNLADHILFSQNGAALIKGEIKLSPTHHPSIVVHPSFYPFEIRQKAAKLVSQSLGGNLGWSLNSRKEIIDKIKSRIEKSLGDLSQVQLDMLDGSLLNWFIEQTSLLKQVLRDQCEELLAPRLRSPKKENGDEFNLELK